MYILLIIRVWDGEKMHNQNNSNRGRVSNGGFSIPGSQFNENNGSGFINDGSHSSNMGNDFNNDIVSSSNNVNTHLNSNSNNVNNHLNSNSNNNATNHLNSNFNDNASSDVNETNLRSNVSKRNGKSKKKKKNKFIISLIVFSIVLAASLFGIYKVFIDKPGISPGVQDIIDEHEKNPNKDEDEILEPYQNLLPTYRQQYSNNYITAHLLLPSVKIDTLVTRAQNNSYYLNHNLYNQYDEMGTSFIDFRNRDVDNDKQVNIYGHNTQYSQYYDKLPFTNLEAYTDEGVFNSYKDVYLSTDNARYKYRVIAVKIITNSDNEHMKVKFSDTNDWLQHTKKLLSNTMYIDSQHSMIGVNDKLLILQACHYNPMNSYILIICKRVN